MGFLRTLAMGWRASGAWRIRAFALGLGKAADALYARVDTESQDTEEKSSI